MKGNALRAKIVALMGATGAGKSTAVRLHVAASSPRRLLVWDPKGEYRALGRQVGTVAGVSKLARAAGHHGPLAAVFRPSFDTKEARSQFDWFCRLAYALGDVQVVADELHQVMTSGWAPAGWNRLVSMGRERAARLIAASQRPADMAKVFWDQATVIRSGRLNGEASARAVAGVLMVPWQEVVALPDLHFIQRSVRRPVIVWGRIEWTRGAPREVVIREKNLPGVAAADTPA